MKVCCVFSLESLGHRDSNEYTQYTIFNIKKGIQGVRNSHGKRAISVRAVEVQLYLCGLMLKHLLRHNV